MLSLKLALFLTEFLDIYFVLLFRSLELLLEVIQVVESGEAVFEVRLKVLSGEGALLDRTDSELGSVEVFDHVGPQIKINELEFIDELIYANVWQQAYILVIDPNSGKVLRQIDATEAVISGRGSGEVLNGIAHNSENGKTYITGKNWPKLFEVSFVKL